MILGNEDGMTECCRQFPPLEIVLMIFKRIWSLDIFD